MNFEGVIFIMTAKAEGIRHNRPEKGPSHRFFFGNRIHDFAHSRSMMAQQEIIDDAPCQESFKDRDSPFRVFVGGRSFWRTLVRILTPEFSPTGA
jgi:hypothetical protein